METIAVTCYYYILALLCLWWLSHVVALFFHSCTDHKCLLHTSPSQGICLSQSIFFFYDILFQVRLLSFGSRRSSSEGVTERGLWPFSQVPYRAPFVAVDCITLNCWGKPRKMAILDIKLTGKQPAAIELLRRVHSTITRLHYHYDNSLVVTITVTCYLWALSTVDHFLDMAPFPDRRTASLIILPAKSDSDAVFRWIGSCKNILWNIVHRLFAVAQGSHWDCQCHKFCLFICGNPTIIAQFIIIYICVA